MRTIRKFNPGSSVTEALTSFEMRLYIGAVGSLGKSSYGEVRVENGVANRAYLFRHISQIAAR